MKQDWVTKFEFITPADDCNIIVDHMLIFFLLSKKKMYCLYGGDCNLRPVDGNELR